jgi:hypothetical protein
MADPNPTDALEAEDPGFPFVTAGITLVTLFVFLVLTIVAYRQATPLDEPKAEGEPKADPATKLGEIRSKNQAALEGTGAKMSAAAATAELLDRVKKDGKLPFPVEPPAQPALAEEPKKKP